MLLGHCSITCHSLSVVALIQDGEKSLKAEDRSKPTLQVA